MRPKKQTKDPQGELFRARLDNLLDRRHELFRLAGIIDWSALDGVFGTLYCEEQGRPGVPTRVMVGLHFLKHMYDESDESVVAKFVENPYWQYFCGLEFFVHTLPIDPSSMTRFRRRVGPSGVEEMLRTTLAAAQKKGLLRASDVAKVNVDTTVMEKAIAYPTDARLYDKARRRLVGAARRRGVVLRQSYARVGKRAFVKQARYAHAQQFKRARRETRKLRTMLGRVVRDVRRKCPRPDEKLAHDLGLCERLLEQKRDDKGKLYSLWAPEVECISKGKAHKRWEFGCKVGVVATSKRGWVVGVQAFHGAPYDGHTLASSLAQAEHLTGMTVEQAFCDKGYRGVDAVGATEVCRPDRRRKSPSLRRWMRRRSAIEPDIGHLKSDCGMDRNHLHGQDGDAMNAMLAGCGFNLRKVMRELSRAFFMLVLWVLYGSRGDERPGAHALVAA